MNEKNRDKVERIVLGCIIFVFALVIIFTFKQLESNAIKTKNEGISSTKVQEQVNSNITKPKKYKVEKVNGAYVVDGVVIVNKNYSLDSDYTYLNNKEMFNKATQSFEQMQQAAAKEGLQINIVSRYRSYETQKELYEFYKSKYSNVDTFSAQAGHSEHQTGLAFDVNGSDLSTRVKDCFQNTKEYKWLKENAYKYGFILRYKKGKEDITGYKFEPWHYRYVGKTLSKELETKGLTLEEYFGLN